jgi:hypothetical protein
VSKDYTETFNPELDVKTQVILALAEATDSASRIMDLLERRGMKIVIKNDCLQLPPNPDLPKLLRSMAAGSRHQQDKTFHILEAAATELEMWRHRVLDDYEEE